MGWFELICWRRQIVFWHINTGKLHTIGPLFIDILLLLMIKITFSLNITFQWALTMSSKFTHFLVFGSFFKRNLIRFKSFSNLEIDFWFTKKGSWDSPWILSVSGLSSIWDPTWGNIEEVGVEGEAEGGRELRRRAGWEGW